jgi:hypothetical protein
MRQWWMIIFTGETRPVDIVVHGGEVFRGFRDAESARVWARRYIGGAERRDQSAQS